LLSLIPDLLEASRHALEYVPKPLKSAAVQRDFLAGVAHLLPQVGAMRGHELLADFQPQPQKEGPTPAAVLGEFAAQRRVGLPDHVGGINAALQPPVRAQANHALQVLPGALDQGSEGGLVGGAGGLQQLLVA
jgi:hypothetical protein